MSKKVIIIGGGVSGLCSAYYLHKDGHEVTVLDQSDMTGGASYVNAGYITPSHIIPLAAPGMMTQGLKWMFNSSSPFYMKPRWDLDFFKWAWKFYKSSNALHVERAIPIIKESNILSRELFQEIKESGDLGDFHLERKGLLMLYKTDKEGEHEWNTAQKAKFLGLKVRQLNKETLKQMEPHIAVDAKGAIYYECDGHTSPAEFMDKMKSYLKGKGVKFLKNTEVKDLVISKSMVTTVKTQEEDYRCDTLVITAGAWSQSLLKKLALNMPLQAGKGYSINTERKTRIGIPAILMEAKVAVTPMVHGTRFAGTMEFSGLNHAISAKRVKAIAAAASAYYPAITLNDAEISKAQCGLRPVSPDGLPYIGGIPKFENTFIATGHAMMGWSLGPLSGKLIAQLVADEKRLMSIDSFAPSRFH